MEAQKLLTAGEAVTPPPAMPQTISIHQTLGPFGSIRTTVTEDGVVTSAPDPLDPLELIVEAHASLREANVDGRFIMRRVTQYLQEGTLEDAGMSTIKLDPNIEALAYVAPVTGPKQGDLFTTDYVSFYVVANPEVLVGERTNLVIHVPDGADWKTAVWDYIGDPGRAVQVWDANGIPTPVGPAD